MIKKFYTGNVVFLLVTVLKKCQIINFLVRPDVDRRKMGIATWRCQQFVDAETNTEQPRAPAADWKPRAPVKENLSENVDELLSEEQTNALTCV
jgi:hypothetical protein